MKKNVAYLLTIFFIVSCSDSENTESNSENVEQKKYEWRLVTVSYTHLTLPTNREV